MADPVFPLQSRQDSSHFSTGREDVAVVGSLEGGYDHVRPRTTRTARATYTIGFTDLTQDEKNQLVFFFASHGKFTNIEYTEPTTEEVLTVRITDWPDFKYTGIGGQHFYNLHGVKLKQV